jgi:hypothetical protein
VFLIAIGGGTISLLLGELSAIRTAFAVIGIGSIIALVAFVLILDNTGFSSKS